MVIAAIQALAFAHVPLAFIDTNNATFVEDFRIGNDEYSK
tara:strand:- start:429 stop:548 length:120 start_codon:yes stop_codon:yes gene_type:complete